MKIHQSAVMVALSCLPAQAQDAPAKVAMRDVPTHEQVVEAAAKARENSPLPLFRSFEGEDPSVANKPEDLISRSEIICYRGYATIVPKRAIIHVPSGMADRLAMQEGSRLGSWSDFLTANRAWIRTVAISRAQAEGNKPLDEATLKSFEKESRLVVATYQEGPISVLPLKVPEEAPAAPHAVPTVAAP